MWTIDEVFDFDYPNISVYRRLKDGVWMDWKIAAKDGYVFYDTLAEDVDMNPDTQELFPVTFYHREGYLPLNYIFDNFPYIAVQEDNIDSQYIL